MLGGFPKQSDLYEPIIKVIEKNNGSINCTDLYEKLALEIRLSISLLEIRISTGRKYEAQCTEHKWDNLVRQAIRKLKENKEVVSYLRGVYRIP